VAARARIERTHSGANEQTGYIVACMWLAAACSEANIRAAPTAKLIATAKTKV